MEINSGPNGPIETTGRVRVRSHSLSRVNISLFERGPPSQLTVAASYFLTVPYSPGKTNGCGQIGTSFSRKCR